MSDERPPHRLAIIASDFPPLSGGIARLCWELSQRLAGQGWYVTVIAPNWGEGPEPPSRADARIIRVGGRRPLRDLRMAWKLRGLGRVDAVMCATWYPDGLVTLLAGARAPVAIWAHGNELYDRNERGLRGMLEGVRRGLRGRVFRRADVIFANSQFTRDLVREFGPAGARVEVMPLGTDPDVFRPDLEVEGLKRRLGLEGKRVVLSTGRLAAYKGHETILRAIPLMASRGELSYLIVGEGPHRPVLEELSQELDIRDLVRFAGKVSDQELPLYYAMADVFVLCTEERRDEASVEGFGIVFLEASASGVPVVGTKAGGIPDAVEDGETGFLVSVGDAGAVAEAVERLLQDSALRAEMGRKGRQRIIDGLNWDETARAVSEELRVVLRGRGPHPGVR